MSPSGTFRREDSSFRSQGTLCRGTLYLPDGETRPPVVVMAHGFAAERAFRLPAYAERFARSGLAVFLFDYRNFGESEGEPRNWVSPSRHVQDWLCAIEHVRSLPGTPFRSIGLWGTSLSGAHVIVAAAKDGGVSAVSSQIPFAEDLPHMGRSLGVKYMARALVAGLRDLVGGAVFRNPYRIPVVGDPETFAVMNRPDSMPGYLALVPESSSWENTCPARVLLSVMTYRPGAFAHRVSCPTLIVLAEGDSLISAAAVERMASRIPDAEVVRLPIGHFDPYWGDPSER